MSLISFFSPLFLAYLGYVWHWLHEKKNGIVMEDRPHLLLAFKRILYAECEDDLEEHYDNLASDEVMLKYPNFAKYVADIYKDRTSWALCHRAHLPTRGNNTNNYCDAQFLVIKDEIINCQKEVNVVRCWTSLVQSLISTTEINSRQLHQANSMEFTVDGLRYNLLNVILYILYANSTVIKHN